MLIEDRLKELKDKINEKVPPGITVSEVEFEGPELVIYTDDPKRFADEADLIRILARDLRKRIVVRPNVLGDPDQAIQDIREVVAENAGITDIFFDADTGEVLIEAEKPGVVIGKNGATLREITKHIGWTPKVVRTPPIESSTVKQVRQYLRSINEERKQFLRTIGRRIHRDVTSKDPWVRVTMLGCCREVGRAAFLLSTPESKVLIDCGEKPDNSNNNAPYLYVPEIHPLSQLDAVVLTHAHLDHCALVPLLFKYGYDGPVYSTPPTRDLAAMLQLDYLDVVSKEDRKIPYSSNEVKSYLKHSITLNYGSVTDIAPDIKLTLHHHPCLCRRAIPGSDACTRRGDPEREDPGCQDLPRRDDTGGHGDPYHVSRVPEQRAPEPDIQRGVKPVPGRMFCRCRFVRSPSKGHGWRPLRHHHD